VRLSCVCGTPPSFRIWAELKRQVVVRWGAHMPWNPKHHQTAACTGVRLNDGSRRSGAFELRERYPPVIQDLGGTEAAMSGPLGCTHALEPDAHVRRPYALACA